MIVNTIDVIRDANYRLAQRVCEKMLNRSLLMHPGSLAPRRRIPIRRTIVDVDLDDGGHGWLLGFDCEQYSSHRSSEMTELERHGEDGENTGLHDCISLPLSSLWFARIFETFKYSLLPPSSPRVFSFLSSFFSPRVFLISSILPLLLFFHSPTCTE